MSFAQGFKTPVKEVKTVLRKAIKKPLKDIPMRPPDVNHELWYKMLAEKRVK